MSRRLVFLVFTFLALFFPIFPAAAAEKQNSDNSAIINEVMDYLQEYHLSNPDRDSLTYGAIQGMLDTLDDPYAEYFSPDEIQSFTDALNGDLEGVGIQVRAGDKNPFVEDVLPGTPAEKEGIKQGDLIIAVDGKDTTGQKLSEVVDKIRGPHGTKVTLTIRRGEKELDVTLNRAAIHVSSVKSEMMAGNTGYISVASFGSSTAEEFDNAVKNLQNSGMKSLIIDLRDNGGGYLEAAVDMLDDFLVQGSTVVSIVDNKGEKIKINTMGKPFVKGLPVAVLVNDYTASASEIMAAALKDYGMAAIIGNTTFGKGVVQNIIPLSNGGAVKFTVYKYLTPSGADIDKVGIKPDQFVLTNALQKEVAWELLHPEDNPDLVFDSGAKNVKLNGQKVDLNINIIKKNNRAYLPLRPVLESMLYQVDWQDGIIKVMSGEREIKKLSTFDLSGLLLENETSYIPVDMLKDFKININQKDNIYELTRQIP
ncbi:S41 family peptidase [Desulfotruncus alcoholivorax]|uniref:S41 family peptidase n=1 Tax=Desulfotruncus alcoholivorax TaxID=265477 RepID=UPI000421A0A7|nr:S41 family peptidase [Desulfotruncus alcoholivorax]